MLLKHYFDGLLESKIAVLSELELLYLIDLVWSGFQHVRIIEQCHALKIVFNSIDPEPTSFADTEDQLFGHLFADILRPIMRH